MKFFKNILYIFFIVVCGCFESRTTPNNTVSQNKIHEDKPQLRKVILKGKSDDLEAFKYFSVYNLSSPSFTMLNYVDDKIINNDSLFLVIDSLTTTQLISIRASSSKTSYTGKLLINPGDVVLFEIKNGKLKFIGDNAPLNNFYSSLYDSTPKYHHNSYEGNIQLYKNVVDSIYNKKRKYLNQYLKDHDITSEPFINTVKSDLKFEHLSELIPMAPGLNSIIQKEYTNDEDFFDYRTYFGNISADDFKDENHLILLSYRNALLSLTREYFENSGNLPYSREKLLAEKEFIDNNFEGKIREFLTASLIFNYDINGFGNSENSVSFFKEFIDEFEEKHPKSSYNEGFQEIKNNLGLFGFELTDSALNTKLISKEGDTITLKEIFNRSSERIKVIDFWASWCSPCINEITKVKSFRDKLSVENNVEWIYLSIDEDKKKWLKKSKELGEFLNVRNQYFIVDGNKSPLAKSLNVQWIPRYIIFNKQNKIVLNNAPLPSDKAAFQNVIENIK